MASQLKLLLEEKKRQRKRGLLRVKRGVRQLFPGRMQRSYQGELNRMVSKLIELTRERIYPELPLITEEANASRPNEDSILFRGIRKIANRIFRKNDFSDRITEAIESTRIGYEQFMTEPEIINISENIANETSEFNRKEISKVIKRMVGVDVFFDEPWLNQEINAFVKSNVDLIKTIPERYFSDIQEVVFRGARQGIRHEEIRKELVSRYGKTRNIAKRIARDQINKFNGQLTQLRQTSLGVKRYTWVTAGDERVRGNPSGRSPDAIPSHFARNGKKYSWNNPPTGGHPGEAIQCRCWAEPILEDLI